MFLGLKVDLLFQMNLIYTAFRMAHCVSYTLNHWCPVA